MRALQSRRGTTLVELLVYMGLLSMGMIVVGGIQLSAQKTAALQRDLIDIQLQANTYLGQLRQDVEASAQVTTADDVVQVTLPDGRVIQYGIGQRLAFDASGEPAGRQLFSRHESLRAVLEPSGGLRPRLTVEATFAYEDYSGRVQRTFKRTALPRCEVTGG